MPRLLWAVGLGAGVLSTCFSSASSDEGLRGTVDALGRTQRSCFSSQRHSGAGGAGIATLRSSILERHRRLAALRLRGGATASGRDDYYDGGNYGRGGDYGGYEDDPYGSYEPPPSRQRGGRDRYQEDYDYDAPPRGARQKVQPRQGLSVGGIDVTKTLIEGNKKWGIMGMAAGVLITMFGASFFFEKNLIRLGNLSFVGGISLFIGPSRTVRYFTRPAKLRGTIIFLVGLFLVFTGRPILGLALEVFGFLNLFGNLLPMVGAMAKNLPIVKDLLPSEKSQRRKAAKKRRPPPPPPPQEDDYYRDGRQDDYYREDGYY